MSLTFAANDGTSWPFDGSTGVAAVGEAEGIFNVPVDMVLDQRVSGDGALLVTQRRAHRRVVLQLLLVDPDGTECLSLWGGLVRSLAAGGTLIYDGPNGPRQLRDVVLEAPDRSMTGQDLAYRADDVIPVSLIALDPWWYGPVVTTTGTFGAPTPWNAALPWDSAIPWNGGASATVANDGDTPAWATIVVEGPATTASFSVDGVGGWETAAEVTTGEYLSVSSEPDRRGPHRGPHGLYAGADGPVDWSLLTEGSQLLDLPAGSSSLVFGASGTSGATEWTLSYRPKFLTP